MKMSAAAYEKGCEYGDEISCVKAGFMYSDGKDGIQRDVKKAKELFSRGCKYGNNQACNAENALK